MGGLCFGCWWAAPKLNGSREGGGYLKRWSYGGLGKCRKGSSREARPWKGSKKQLSYQLRMLLWSWWSFQYAAEMVLGTLSDHGSCWPRQIMTSPYHWSSKTLHSMVQTTQLRAPAFTLSPDRQRVQLSAPWNIPEASSSPFLRMK